MKVEDLIALLNNRLREFKLSRDYATMSGDLERIVAADKEIIALEDTLFKLSLLVDASQSAAVKETTVAEVITDGSVAVLGEYDITPYATDPQHEEKIMNILSTMGLMDTAEHVDNYIKSKYANSPVTGEMIISAAKAYTVDARLMMAIMEQDSRFGTVGLAVSTTNPGNVGNDDSGNTRTYASWQDGVTAVAEWLSRHRISKTISELPDNSATSTPPVATSTPTSATSTSPFIEPITASTTPAVATSTDPISQLETIFQQATTTPETATTTTEVATTTPEIITTILETATTTPETATTTPETATTTQEIPVIIQETATTTAP